MSSDIGRIGDGSVIVPMNDAAEVQETKSAAGEKPAVEKQTGLQNNEAPVRASLKEASVLKAELSLGGSLQEAKVKNQFEDILKASIQNETVIKATSGNDNVHVSKAPGLAGSLGLYEVNVNGNVQLFTKEQLKKVVIETGAGNDTIVIDKDVKVGIHVKGGSGDDVIIGGGGADVLEGESGNDYIGGRGGDDVIMGGPGDDFISGGAGSDKISGGEGDDRIEGGRGIDFILGGKGDDVIDGGPADDYIDGGSGNNKITDDTGKEWENLLPKGGKK